MIKASTAQDYRERIVRTLVYIQQYLDDDASLDAAASVAAFSPFHFHRIFRGLMGETLKEHVRRLRLERAARHLKQRPGEPIVQLALEAGFETHESFTRAFHSMFNVSPSAYRDAHKPAPDSASGTHIDDVSGYHSPGYPEVPPVELKDLPPARIVFLRHVGPYSEVGDTWGRLMSWAGRRGLLGPGMKLIGIVHDDPDVTPSGKVRYDAGVTVTRPVQPEGDFGVMDLPGGTYAVVTHKGPYEGLSATYQKIYGGWLPASGRQLRDTPPFEQYLNSPRDTKPEDLVTLIHVPVE
jgi:AraC family transcriptional regulator